MKTPDGKLNNLALARTNLALMRQIGRAHDALDLEQLRLSLSPLRNGTLGAKIGVRLHQALTTAVTVQDFQPTPKVILPDIPPERRIGVGHEIGTGRLIAFDLLNAVKHALFIGSTGVGKTSLLKEIIWQLVMRDIYGEFWDHKQEGRGIPGAMPFKPHQEPINWLSPIGHPETYFLAWCAEFGRAFGLKHETWTELVSVLSRIFAGLRPGDPFPSLKDFERVLFKLQETEGRSKFATAAFALRSLNAVLGKTASIRQAPDIRGRFAVIVYDLQGLPHRTHSFLTSLRLLRTQLSATQEASRPKHFIISDEANEEFSSELLDGSSIGLNTYKRAPMQLRSSGIGIFGGGQVLSQFDPSFTSNVITKGVFRIPDYQEARAAVRWMNLSDEAIPTLQNLGVGQMYFHTDGMGAPVLVKVDLFSMKVNQAEAAAFQEEQRVKLEQAIDYAPHTDDAVEPISYLDILGESKSTEPAEAPAASEPIKIGDEYVRFLQTTSEHPEKSITQLYDVLGLSRGKGNRLKEETEALGLISVEEGHSTNGRPPKFIRLTPQGKAALHDLQSPGPRESGIPS